MKALIVDDDRVLADVDEFVDLANKLSQSQQAS